MRFGISLPHSGSLASKQAIRQIAIEAEGLGFDSLWVHDHISYGVEWKEHRTTGIAEDDSEWKPYLYESLVTLAYVAGITAEVSLGTSVLVLPLRDPRVLARQTMTLQDLSGGRLLLGVGIGDYPAEFQVMDVRYADRAELTDEYLEVLASIYRGSTDFSGQTITFNNASFLPRVPPIPILVGGGIVSKADSTQPEVAEAPLRRAARWASGWIPEGPPSQIAAGIAMIRNLSEQAGRVPTAFEVHVASPLYVGDDRSAHLAVGRNRDYELVGSIDMITRNVSSYRSAGATGMILRCWASDLRSYVRTLELFARDVMPLFGGKA